MPPEGEGLPQRHDSLPPPRALAVIERLVKQLNVAYKAVKLYPPTSNIPRDAATAIIMTLRSIFENEPTVRFMIDKEGLLHESGAVFPGHPAFAEFAKEFYSRNLAEVRFHAGVTGEEVIGFLQVLAMPVPELSASGGFEHRLWDLQVDDVSVKEASAKVVDHDLRQSDEVQHPGEPWPPEPLRIEEILQGAIGRQPRDQRLLVRIVNEGDLLDSYLRAAPGRGEMPSAAWLTSRVSSLSRSLMGQLPEDRDSLHRSLAEAVMRLDPDARRHLLGDKLLPLARHDEAVMSLLRQMELGELCRALVEGLEETFESREGLARALHNLALVSTAGRDEVLASAGHAMREGGLGEAFVSDVLEDAAPSRLVVSSRERTAEDRPIDRILQLIELTPAAEKASGRREDEVERLRQEAAEGISDGDVIGTLVTLATLERKDDAFASVIAVVEDSLGLLIERQDFDVAASAAAVLTNAEFDETRSVEQRKRIKTALRALADPKRMRVVTDALRLYRHDTLEHQSCRRLLAVLGSHAIAPLLEVLANEEDMAARKAIVDLLSNAVAGHVSELGDRISDSRWYFVRNVVSILSATRSAEALPHLERTLRHPDARVRRETIRALNGIDDRRGDQMLVAGLDDDDPQNVSLAARYLGVLRLRSAVPALISTALGEGRGSREPGPRVEAIEALGRIGDPSALPALDSIVRQRAMRGRGRARELRAAAQAASAQIRTKGGDA